VVVPIIGDLVVNQSRTTTNPLTAVAFAIGSILVVLSWNRGVPELFGGLGLGFCVVGLLPQIVSLPSAKELKVDREEPKG
jgi:hypothetical protein